jgi:GTPase SAR1 family protein
MSAVTVAVRCRPLSQKEIRENSTVVVSMEGQSTTIVDPLGKIKPLTFTYDNSFWSGDPSTPGFVSQEDVFNAIGKKLLDNTFQGYNGCIFAYGQTGSGKTYSMLGYGEEKGIIPRLCCELFQRSSDKKAEADGRWQCQAEVSYLEIYNEKCRCLLSPNAKQEYRVREHPVTGPYVENLTRMVVHSFEEIEMIMDEGNKTRTVAATNMNATSSRSHAIFTIVFKQITTHESLDNAKSEMCSRLNLVDLAGSERADRTGATGKTLKEGSNINQSLTTLGKVINGLAEGVNKDGQFKKHVPFRDSALTWLLKENLCGNSKTIMLAALSPSGSNYEETVSTLRYANQAKMLRTQAVVNEDPSSKKIRELTDEIERLKALLESGAAVPRSAAGSETELPSSGSQSPRASGEGSEPLYEQMSLEDRMALAKRLLQQESQSWEERETNTTELQQLRAKVSQQRGMNSKKDLPRLFNLNEDPSMSGCLMYVLPVGKTQIGSEVTNVDQDVQLEGDGILPHHAVITVLVVLDADGGASPSGPTKYETLVLPLGTVRVNGCLIAKETTLRHGDRLIIGEYHIFSFSDSKAGRMAADGGSGLSLGSGSGTDIMDYHKAVQEKFEQERAAFARQQEEMLRKLEEEKRRNEENERRLQEQEEQLLLRAAAEPVAINNSFVAAREQIDKEHETKLRDLEDKLKAMEAQQKHSLAHRYLSQTSVVDATRPQISGVANHRDPYGGAAEHHSPMMKLQSSLIQAATIAGNKVARLPNQQIFRQKVVLLGHQEVGKTSLRKCFESDPIFFKKLPDVKATTGIETQMKSMKVQDEQVDLCISDFAGQEAYHSHTLFLTGRSVFVLVWKISTIEQDFHSSGISDHELHRLMMWVNECYSKFPRCAIVLAATHLDELRDQSQKGVEFILNKVEKAIMRHIDDIARLDTDTGKKVIPPVVANVAVTCKNRIFVAAGDQHRALSGGKISALLQIIANTAYKQCFEDEVFRCGAVPGRHIRLMQEILEMKNNQPQKLLLPLSEYVHMAVRFGVENDAELLQITQLMHSWNCVYMFNQHKIHENLFIFLHPSWLCRLAGVLFSFAHVLRTPIAHRSMIGGLEYQISAAEQADMHMMRKGFLRLPLARVLFRQPLASFLKKEPEEADFNMALQLLASLSLIQNVEVKCDDQNVLLEETIATSPVRSRGASPFGFSETQPCITRWFVPSLSPFLIPAELRKLAPVLFQRGVHVKFEFNMLPDEMWWRFQFRLQEHQMVVSVRTPKERLGGDDDLDDDEDPDEYRLPEADEDHNRWKDAMWLCNEHSRVLLLRDGRRSIFLYSADADAKGSQALLEVIETTILELLDEYRGIQRQVFVACPIPTCNGWHDVRNIAVVGGAPTDITCPACKNTYPMESVVASGIGEFGPKHFSAAVIKDAQALLQWALDPRVCEAACNFLGVEAPQPIQQAPSSDDQCLSPVDLSHYDFLAAIDKVIRALLLRGVLHRSTSSIEPSDI